MHCEPSAPEGTLLDICGRRRSPATLPGYHAGRKPGNAGQSYPADPPSVLEIVAVMKACDDSIAGQRLRALIVVLWRSGIRISEALALRESDLDERANSILIRAGKGGKRRLIGMDDWGWQELRPWIAARETLPVGTVFPIVLGASIGKQWSAARPCLPGGHGRLPGVGGQRGSARRDRCQAGADGARVVARRVDHRRGKPSRIEDVLLLLPPPGPTIVPDAWRPTLEQVAAILRARTRGIASRDASVAGEQDVFNSITRPTAAQVNECIDLAVDEMFGLTGGREPCSTNLSRGFRTAALYRAAMLVEISYMPEETNDDDTAFAALEKMWQDSSKMTAAAIVAQCPITAGGDDYAGEPAGRVPLRCPTTWWTRT